MKKLNRVLLVVAVALAAVVAKRQPANATIYWSEGCISWSATFGCMVYQQCWADDVSGRWACYDNTL
jgi:hypothetical protein